MTNAINNRRDLTNNDLAGRLREKYQDRGAARNVPPQVNNGQKNRSSHFDPFTHENTGVNTVGGSSRARCTSEEEMRRVARTRRESEGKVKLGTASAAKAASHKKADALPRVKNAPVPVGMLFAILTATLLMLALIFSYCDISNEKSINNKLQKEKADLALKISDEKIDIEKLYDVTEIERLAAELGMVNGDSVEKKFVSVSGGESIELVNPSTEEVPGSENFFTNLLSALSSGFTRLGELIN